MKMPEVNNENIKFDELKYKIRNLVDTYYDIQKLRISTGGRIFASFSGESKESQKANDKDTASELSKKKDSMLTTLVKEHKRITDIYVEKFQQKGNINKAISITSNLEHIKDKIDYQLVTKYVELLNTEQECAADVAMLVKQHYLWDAFFKDALGCGPMTAALCISYLNIYEARHVSCFWSYVGVGTRVSEDGKREAMSRKTLVDVEYVDKNGDIKTKKSIGYNSTMHDYFLGVFSSNILRARGGKYAKVYYDYKNRYENRADLAGAPKMRLHRMASRQVAKAFLRDLWCVWREAEGYTLSLPYEVEYLDRAPHEFNEAHYRRAIGS